MNTLIRITGYVEQADVLEPIIQIDKNDIFHEKESIKKYRLFLMANNLSDAMSLEAKIEYLDYEWYLNHTLAGENNLLPSLISYENGLIFETLYQPRLEGSLKKAHSDDELLWKYVQVVGHIQQQELGNCFLSFHIVEPATHPADGFDA